MRAYRRENVVQPPEPADTHIGGYAGELAERFFEERMLSDAAVREVLAEAESAFFQPVDDATSVGYWRGEFWGKLAISAARVCRYNGNAQLKQTLRESAYRVLSCQRADGYIGSYQNEDFVRPNDPEVTKREVGWACDWCWNIWCRKYTLWGLLECCELLEDEKILAGCRRLADHLLAQLDRLHLTLGETGTFHGMPSGSIIKPMLVLYRFTGDERYLKLCVETAENWDRDDGRTPNLIRNALSGKPVGDWYPGEPWGAKVYEMLSCLDGLLELYRVTGTEKYLEACRAMYALLEKYELNVLFSVGYNDQFINAAGHMNAITEPCDVVHWMRLCYELFTLTGESRYMDSFELAYLNPFLASVFDDGKWGARGVRGHGRHLIAHQCGFEHNHCCVNNLPRGFMNAAQAAVMRGEAGLYINLFSDFDAKLRYEDGQDAVSIRGSYARDCRATVRIDHQCRRAEKAHIRVPAWSHKSEVRVNGTAYAPREGEYFEVELLPNSVATVEIAYDRTPVLTEWKPACVQPETAYKPRRWCNLTEDSFGALGEMHYDQMIWDARCTLRVGPILLARSKKNGNTEAEMFETPSVAGKPCACTLRPVEDEGCQCRFDATLSTPDGERTTRMCDYASAANRIVDDERYFSIWL